MVGLQARENRDLLNWAWPLAIAFGAAQVIAGIVFFFAYNWNHLSDAMKIGLPQAIMVLAVLAFAMIPKSYAASRVLGIAATMMIGVSMAVVGQVYQLGADPWQLFATWAFFAAIITAVLRDDVHFAITLTIGSIAYFLYANEELFAYIAQPKSLIPAIYSVAVLAILLARENLGNMPQWLRWVMVAAILIAGLTGAFSDIFGRGLFKDGWTSSLALIFTAGVLIRLYRGQHLDGPVRAMALFALAIIVGLFGIRVIFLFDVKGVGSIALALLISAVWIISVTGVLAKLLRKMVVKNEAGR